MITNDNSVRAPAGHRPAGFDPSRAAEYLTLAEGIEHAARVTWRWLSDDESPWEQGITLIMVERLSRLARELRAFARDSDASLAEDRDSGLSGEAVAARPEGIAQHD